MKVMHVALCSYPYVSTWGYQENHMIEAHHKLGHEVIVLTSPYVPDIYREYINEDKSFKQGISVDALGTKIIRLKYKYPFPDFINKRIRLYKGVYNTIEKENPDVIFVHDLQFFSINSIKKYLYNHPECIAKADTHVCYENSANNWLSKNFLHKIIYRQVVKKSYKFFQKVYYLTRACACFMEELYHIFPNDKFEFLPLGGIVISTEEKNEIRKKIRAAHNLKEDDVMILHSGKLEKGKKTHELLKAFRKIEGENLHLYIIGAIPDSQKEQLNSDICKDNRVSFLGWKSSQQLREYLCAADFYAQPGTQSSTLQTAMCCGCPCILNMESKRLGGGYSSFLSDDMVYPIDSEEELEGAIYDMCHDKELRIRIGENAQKYAEENFDYIKQVKRITQDDRTNKKE